MSNDYRIVTTVVHGEVSAELTWRMSNIGTLQYSYRFFRTYSKDGATRSTSWMNPRHMGAVIEVIKMLDAAIEEDRAKRAGSQVAVE